MEPMPQVPRYFVRPIATRDHQFVIVYAALDAPGPAGYVPTIGYYPDGWRPIEGSPGQVIYEPDSLTIWLADVLPETLEPPHAEPIAEDQAHILAPHLREFVEDALEALRTTGTLDDL